MAGKGYKVVRGCHLGLVFSQFGATSNIKALACLIFLVENE
jgi:hypothetical protein